MKKSLVPLLVSLLLAPATAALAEDIYYDGNLFALQPDPLLGGTQGLYPSIDLSGNAVVVNAPVSTISGNVYGGVTTGSGNVSGNRVIFMDGTASNLYGGYSDSGNASDNTVILSGGTIPSTSGRVYGGYSDSGHADNNSVTVTGGNMAGAIYGGFSNGNGSASGNALSVKGITDTAVFTAGQSSGGIVQNNLLTVSDTNASHTFKGGQSDTGTVTNNRVNITDSRFYAAFGGNSTAGSLVSGNAVNVTNSTVATGAASAIVGGHGFGNSLVENNSVTVTNTSATRVYGGLNNESGNTQGNTIILSNSTVSSHATAGYSAAGAVTGNTVTIQDGTTVNGNVRGGVTGTGTATGNTVNLIDGTVTGTVWGGNGSASAGDVFTGNTLHVAKRFTVGGLNNFEYLNFTLPADIQANSSDAVLTANTVDLGGAVTVSGIGISPGAPQFVTGDTVSLIRSGSAIGGSLASNTAQTRQGLSLIYDWDINLNPNTLTATLSGLGVNPKSRDLLLGRLDEMALLKQGGDLLAGRAIENMVASAKAGNKAFFAMQGGTSQYKTGPDFDLDSVTFMGGASWGTTLASGNDVSAGAFVEAGFGSYRGHTDFTGAGAIKADGNARYFGGGLLGEMDFNNGFTVDAAFRIGHIQSDWKSDFHENGQRATYDDTSSLYLGAHIGGAYQWAISGQDSLNTYARYSWAHIDSDNVTVLNDPYQFDSVTSSRIRIGTKYTRHKGHFMPYAGIAWEYEFDGREGGTVYGYKLKELDLGGNTVIAELGMSWLPTADENLRLNLALEGFAGNREGVMGSFRFHYRF